MLEHPESWGRLTTAMVTLTAAHKSAIERVVSPGRARFDLATRSKLSRDDGIRRPSLWGLSGRTVADGVVWPESEQQLVDLVRIARAEGIPLVPRGGGTAASGGAVPADGGLVVDLSRLSGLAEPDADAADGPGELVVDVRAGTLWTSLAAALAPAGLAPRLYPSSAPFSTVGGWLAQGGAGIGSFAFGWFDQNVVGARLVDDEGRVHALSGIDLDGVSEAQGTTGIITHVRLQVRPASPISTVAIAFPDAAGLAEALHLSPAAVVESKPGDYVVHAAPSPELVAALTAWLRDHGVALGDLRAGKRTLEEVFLQVTSEPSTAGGEEP